MTTTDHPTEPVPSAEAGQPIEAVESVDGAQLLDDLVDALVRYVVLPNVHAVAAVVLWIAATTGNGCGVTPLGW